MRISASFGLMATALVAGAAGLSGRAQAPQFLAAADAVAVPVLVKSGGRPVGDLTVDDFALTDSGVPQTITALQGVDAPLDVSIVVQQTMYFNFRERDTFTREIEDVRKLLRPTDRLEILSTTYGGQILLPFGPPDRDVRVPVEPFKPCGPVYDTLSQVLMRPPTAGRQHVALLFTEGEGDGGAMTGAAALSMARRSHVAVSALTMMPRWIGGTITVMWGQTPLCADARAAWNDKTRSPLRSISLIDHPDDQDRALYVEERQRLQEFVEVTGGHRLNPSVMGRSIVSAVRAIVEEARHRYILYYTPISVPRTGWHPLQVTVRHQGRFDITARPGYER